MSRNVIDDKKSIHVKETLFEEILNGFSKIKEKQDKKSIKLETVQRKRLVRVAEAFLNNKGTNVFTKEWVGRLSGSTYNEKLLQFILQDEEEDEDEFEEDEEEDKKVSNSFSLLNAYRLFSTMNTLYAIYKAYNRVKDIVSNYNSINIQIDNRGIGDRNAKIIQQVKLIEKLYTEALEPFVIIGGNALVKFIETNKHIDALFKKLDEFIEDQKKRFIITLGVDVALSFLPCRGQAKWVQWAHTAATWEWRTYKWSNLIYNAAVYYNYYTNGLAGVTVDAEDVETFINDKITMPHLIPAYLELDRRIENFLEGVDTALDVASYVESRKQDFTDDVVQLQRASNIIRNNVSGRLGERTSQIRTNSPNVRFDSVFDVRSNSYEISPQLRGIGNSIISSMFNAHSTRFNFMVDDQSFEALFDENNGLHVLRALNKLRVGVIPVVSNFYSNFYTFIDKVRDGLIEKIEEDSIKINNEITENSLTPAQSLTTGEQYTRDEILSDFRVGDLTPIPSSRVESPTPPPNLPARPDGQLRLSERSLQPIHPIFVNNAMIGLELELLDSRDNQISIKIPNWNNPVNGIKIAEQSKLNVVNNYLSFHADYDQMKDVYLELLEVEKEYDKNLQELIDELLSKISANYQNEILSQYE